MTTFDQAIHNQLARQFVEPLLSGGAMLAGSMRKKRKRGSSGSGLLGGAKKKKAGLTAWQRTVKRVHKEHPKMDMTACFKKASKEYQGKSKGKKKKSKSKAKKAK